MLITISNDELRNTVVPQVVFTLENIFIFAKTLKHKMILVLWIVAKHGRQYANVYILVNDQLCLGRKHYNG